jgi:hypothetical protein
VARIVESISSEVIHAKSQNKIRSARWRHHRRGHSIFHDAEPALVDRANAAVAEPASDAEAGSDSITHPDACADSNANTHSDAGAESQPESVPALIRKKLQRRARSEVAAERGLYG